MLVSAPMRMATSSPDISNNVLISSLSLNPKYIFARVLARTVGRRSITVAAAYSKRRRQDTIPLLPELTDLLTKHVATIAEGTPVFRVPDKPAEMLRDDLADARKAWLEQVEDPEERQRWEKSDHLRYRTAAGVIDFHALRHTFITNLARGGVHPKLAQDLARHSDINLTMSRYSHTELAERAKALASLPGTKTAGNQPPAVLDEASSLGRRLRIKQRIQATSVDSGGPDGEKPDRAQVLAALEEVLSLMGSTEQPPAGFEPATCGLQNRFPRTGPSVRRSGNRGLPGGEPGLPA